VTQRPVFSGSNTETASAEELPLTVLAQYPRLDGLYRYWLGKRGERRMPPRQAMLPEEMRESLGYIVLVDVTPPPRRFRFRLVGTEIASAYGRDMSGLYVDDITTAAYREMLIEQYGRAADRAEPVLHRLSFVEWPGKVHELVRLILPLAADGQTVNMLLVVSAFGDELKGLRRPLLGPDRAS
jgi:hypothetical protein